MPVAVPERSSGYVEHFGQTSNPHRSHRVPTLFPRQFLLTWHGARSSFIPKRVLLEHPSIRLIDRLGGKSGSLSAEVRFRKDIGLDSEILELFGSLEERCLIGDRTDDERGDV